MLESKLGNQGQNFSIRTKGAGDSANLLDALNGKNPSPQVNLFAKNSGIGYEDSYKGISKDFNTISEIDLIPTRVQNFSFASYDARNTINAFPSINKGSVKSRKNVSSYSGASALPSTREGLSERMT